MIELTVDGEPLRAPAGQSVAAAILSRGQLALRDSPGGSPRGLYCGIGVCQDCLVTVMGVDFPRVTRGCSTNAGSNSTKSAVPINSIPGVSPPAIASILSSRVMSASEN